MVVYERWDFPVNVHLERKKTLRKNSKKTWCLRLHVVGEFSHIRLAYRTLLIRSCRVSKSLISCLLSHVSPCSFLGGGSGRRLLGLAPSAFPSRTELPEHLRAIAERIDGCRSQAEMEMRISRIRVRRWGGHLFWGIAWQGRSWFGTLWSFHVSGIVSRVSGLSSYSMKFGCTFLLW